jgi:hypothetical protein
MRLFSRYCKFFTVLQIFGAVGQNWKGGGRGRGVFFVLTPTAERFNHTQPQQLFTVANTQPQQIIYFCHTPPQQSFNLPNTTIGITFQYHTQVTKLPTANHSLPITSISTFVILCNICINKNRNYSLKEYTKIQISLSASIHKNTEIIFCKYTQKQKSFS